MQRSCAASQSRDRTKYRRLLRPRLSSAPPRAALRPGNKKEEAMATSTPIIAGTRIGHVHLKVADLDRALGFYCGVLGFELMQRYGTEAAFISAGGSHQHI